MSRQINILIGKWREEDKELFFGPLDGTEEWFIFSPDVKWADILVEIGMFKSKGDARKNLFNIKDIKSVNGEIGSGFVSFIFGKLKHHITLLKINDIIFEDRFFIFFESDRGWMNMCRLFKEDIKDIMS